jgi:hypothetical protein
MYVTRIDSRFCVWQDIPKNYINTIIDKLSTNRGNSYEEARQMAKRG